MCQYHGEKKNRHFSEAKVEMMCLCASSVIDGCGCCWLFRTREGLKLRLSKCLLLVRGKSGDVW